MTVEVLVFAAFRIAGSLPVLRWPLAGGLLVLVPRRDRGDLALDHRKQLMPHSGP